MTNYIKEFWLDFAISMYKKAEKYKDYPEMGIVLHISFIQSINISTLLFVVLELLKIELTDFKFMLYIGAVVFIINYFLNKKYNLIQNELSKKRIPKYSNIVYNMYGVVSSIILFVVVYIFRG